MNTLRLVPENKKLVSTTVAFAVAMTLAIGTAYAGTDTTFTPLATKISGWLSGSLGYLLALGAFLVGIVNAIQGNRGFWGMIFPFLLGIVITVGITIISGSFTATI
jgi:hypothetical protein